MVPLFFLGSSLETEMSSMNFFISRILALMTSFISSMWASFRPKGTKLAIFCTVLAKIVRLRLVFWSGISSQRPNKFGLRIAGTKRRRKKNPLTDVYDTESSSGHLFVTDFLRFENTVDRPLGRRKKESEREEKENKKIFNLEIKSKKRERKERLTREPCRAI